MGNKVNRQILLEKPGDQEKSKLIASETTEPVHRTIIKGRKVRGYLKPRPRGEKRLLSVIDPYDYILHKGGLDMSPDAWEKAREISDKYGVYIKFVANMAEFLSEERIQEIAQNNTYPLCANNLTESAEITEFVIKSIKAKYRTNMDKANEDRVKKSEENNQSLASKIKEIKESYISIEGKEPSMNKIAKILTDKKITSPSGKPKWYAETVIRVIEKTESQER